MRRRPILWILLLITGLILAACTSPAGSPDGSDGGQPPTDEPAASQGGGDGDGDGDGGFGGGNGSVDYSISGSYSDSGTLPFAGNYAYFQQAGVTFLVFTDDANAEEANGVILSISDDGNVFQYVTDEIVIPAADCEWNITRNDATGAAGSFNCNDQGGFGTDGQVYADLDISGDFEVGL
jgi:hypothetical protein